MNYNKLKFSIILLYLLAILIVVSKTVRAEDIEVKLNSQDGTTKFAIQDSAGVNVATIDSDGNLVLESSATIKKALRAAKFLTEAKNSGGTLTTDDFGKTITVDDDTTDRTVTLPSVDASNIGSWVRIVKLGTKKVTIQAATGDTIADSGAGGTIYNGIADEDFATITLQLSSATGWIIAGGCGTWITTE